LLPIVASRQAVESHWINRLSPPWNRVSPSQYHYDDTLPAHPAERGIQRLLEELQEDKARNIKRRRLLRRKVLTSHASYKDVQLVPAPAS
jgi:hypothetical protein